MEPPNRDADPDYDSVLQDREDFKASLLKNNMVPNNNFQGVRSLHLSQTLVNPGTVLDKPGPTLPGHQAALLT